MGIPVLILGKTGSGKSTSMRNLKREDTRVLNVAGKPLPFRGKLPTLQRPDYEMIKTTLAGNNAKLYVIDDSQYLMAFDLFDKAKIKGYDKFTDIAVDFESLIRFIIERTTPDTIVYLMHHTETDDTGYSKAKTVGKMLDNQLTVEGLFSIVLMTEIKDGKYCFVTNSDGTNPCKSPVDMFDQRYIENDLAFVDKTIREYWELEPKEVPQETGDEGLVRELMHEDAGDRE